MTKIKIIIALLLMCLCPNIHANVPIIGMKYDVHHLPKELKDKNFGVQLDKSGLIVKIFGENIPSEIEEEKELEVVIEEISPEEPDEIIGTKYDSDNVPDELKDQNFAVELDLEGYILRVFTSGIIKNTNDKDRANISDLDMLKIVKSDIIKLHKFVPLITYSGQNALDVLGSDIDELAAENKVTAKFLKEQILRDDTLRIDPTGRLFVIEKANTS